MCHVSQQECEEQLEKLKQDMMKALDYAQGWCPQTALEGKALARIITAGHWPFSVHFSKMADQTIKQDTFKWPYRDEKWPNNIETLSFALQDSPPEFMMYNYFGGI